MIQFRTQLITAPGRSACLCRSYSDERPRLSVADWVTGPLEALALLPRITTGAIISAPDQIPMLQPKVEKVAQILSDAQLTNEEKQVLCILPSP
jgi:hypothetical protein